ncbi:copper homeostasis protein CutC [Sediminitomix flava]|uniref:PF03932 family protein CutC n=1 Tax=Sediminitomix flava TaxID=379075 RepID=A0A315ZAL3_SEDFL|nr:copper homeostasis protein CutC [Sediminitomix flava]PWJ42189.1 copper homeostasis protein [Sediminitomix flava]
MTTRLEICSYSVESAIKAQSGGADRIELCGGRLEGGTTPSYGMIQQARKYIHVDLHTIIRPRGGDFVYSELEFEEMVQDIRMAKNIGCDGVVIGSLTIDGKVDIEGNKRLIKEARPMKVTFHRAFDMVDNPSEALEELINLGVDGVLTSGQCMTAEEGIELIADLAKQAAGRIDIIPASGINPSNVQRIQSEGGVNWMHSSASVTVESKMRYRNNSVTMSKESRSSEFEITAVDEETVKAMKKALFVYSNTI